MFICSFIAWYAQLPMALWIRSPASTGALQECRQASFKAHKNANKLRIFCQEPSCRRLADFVRPQASLPRTTKDKPAYHCMPIIGGREILFEDPEVPLAAELGSWPWRLQEQTHGVSLRAPSQWGAQSGHRQRPCQLDNVELDSSNKAEAACQVRASSKPTSIPMLSMSLPRLPFLIGTAVPPRHLKFFGCQREMGPQETTRKNEILFYRTSTYVLGNMPSMDVLRNESKQIILLITWNAIGQEILANFVVK